MPTDDGALVAGEPHSASTWYPANEHPRDKASYSFRISVPRGVEAIANGDPASASNDRGGRSIWRWEAKEPMAAYLSTATIGQFEHLARGRSAGARTWTRSTPTCSSAPKPRTGARYAVTGIAQPGYQRLLRTIDVPAGGAKLSFSVSRDTQPGGDFFFVEAHTVGRRRLDDAARRAAPHRRPDGVRLRGRAQGAPVPRALPAAAAVASASRRGTTGRWRGASFPNRELRALGRRPLALRRPQRRGRAHLRHRRRLPVQRRRRRRHRRHAARPARRPSRTTATRSTAGPSRARPRRQHAEHGRLDLGHGRAGAAHGGRRRPGGGRARAGGDRLPRRRLRAVPVLGGRLDHRRPS